MRSEQKKKGWQSPTVQTFLEVNQLKTKKYTKKQLVIATSLLQMNEPVANTTFYFFHSRG